MAAAIVDTTLASANSLLAYHSSLIDGIRRSQREHRRQLHSLSPAISQPLLSLPLIPSPSPSPPSSPTIQPVSQSRQIKHRADLPPAKRARVSRYRNYVPEEETIRNDYSQRYVDGGEWPQNWVLGAEPEHRFEEYPKQHRLLALKKQSVQSHSLPPSYLPFTALSTIQPCKFDVILLDPPFSSSFTWNHLQELPIPSLAADPSFVFLWVGSGAGDGLERGREVLAKWGYRRCEDVVWVRTNKASNKGPGTDPPTTSLLTRTKQHCLIGIRGTVRRSTDSWFVHCNVDTDVIIWEGDPSDPTRKPPEMYTLIENFCLGTRRLEVFGKLSSLRRGWVTVLGSDTAPERPIFVEGEEGGNATRWDRESWENGVKEFAGGGKFVVPMTSDIDALRPKSPIRGGSTNNGSSGGVPLSGGTPAGIGGANMMNSVRFNNGVRQSGFGMEMGVGMPMGMGMNSLGMGVGVDGMMGGGWPGMQVMGNMGMTGMEGMGGMPGMNGMNPGMNGMSVPMMDPQAMQGMNGQGMGMNGMMMAGQGGGYMPMFNGMGGWGDGQFGMDGGGWDGSAMMPGMGGMGMGQWTNY